MKWINIKDRQPISPPIDNGKVELVELQICYMDIIADASWAFDGFIIENIGFEGLGEHQKDRKFFVKHGFFHTFLRINELEYDLYWCDRIDRPDCGLQVPK